MRLFLAAVAAVGLFSSAAVAQTDGQYYRHARHHKATVVTAAIPSNAEAAAPATPVDPDNGRCHNMHWTTWDGVQNFTACNWF
jgi:hypothetical protein